MQYYKIYGQNPLVEIVVEMGLGSVISEWMPMVKELIKYKTVLIYERYGINNSPYSSSPRTPKQIACELNELLRNVPHSDKMILLAHSQGGLYAYQAVLDYPELFSHIVLLDPLSFSDNEFKKQLSNVEYKKSGVDKSKNFKLMIKYNKLHLSFIIKKLLKKAPPFYYFNSYSKEEEKDILNSYTKVKSLQTILEEYREAHCEENLQKKEGISGVKLILITHNSKLAIKENQEFGNNTFVFSSLIETMWQYIMRKYLDCFLDSEYIEAKNSTHYIHLTDIELVSSIIFKLN